MRRVKDIIITAKNRDEGKKFRLTEMPSNDAEKWAIKALLLVCKNNPEFSPEIFGEGLQGLARAGIGSLMSLKFDELDPLLDQMMACVQIVTDRERDYARPLTGHDDVEEAATLMQLRMEVLDLHLGFSVAGIIQPLVSALNPPSD